MDKESDLNRRKFMEIGIYTITGTIAAVSGVALARFAVGSSFDKTKSKWIELNSEDVQDAMPKIQETIEEEDLSVRHIEFVSQYDDTQWDDTEDQILYDGLAKEAENSGEIVWDQISAYESRGEG